VWGKLGIPGLAVVCLMALAGCGSSSSHSASSSASSSTSSPASASSTATTSAATSSAATSSGGEAAKPPAQILTDAASALRHAHGFAMQGSVNQGKQVVRVKLTTTSPSAIDLSFILGPSSAELIGLPKASYIKANATFWRAQAGPNAVKLAGKWIEVPSTSAHSLTSSLGGLSPSVLPRCLAENHGTLTHGGTTTVNGQSAIVIKDAGDKPGSTRSLLAVAATGTPYPLQYTATGAQRAGGPVDVCNSGKASNARGSLTFSEFGSVPPIKAPAGAIKLG